MRHHRFVCTALTLLALAVLRVVFAPLSAVSAQSAQAEFRPIPEAWAGEWDALYAAKDEPPVSERLSGTPPPEKTDAFIIAHLKPAALAKREATPYDGSPGSLCDPEGWFPFINYNYGFALLSSPGKITMIPVEPDTEGIRRVYLRSEHAGNLLPTWNGESVAHWINDVLVVDTIGFNDLSWLGDDREPHSTQLHMVERMELVEGGRYLKIETQISDPLTLTAPYNLTRYFIKYNNRHLGAGPTRSSAELVCNEDPSPFIQEKKK